MVMPHELEMAYADGNIALPQTRTLHFTNTLLYNKIILFDELQSQRYND